MARQFKAGDDEPVIVGVAQQTIHPGTVDGPVDPVAFMADCAGRATKDAAAPALMQEVDALHVVNIFSAPMADPPGALATALGIRPGLREYTAIGGNSPQWLVNRVADNLAAGASRVALLAGCEVMYSMKQARRSGMDVTSLLKRAEIPMVGDTRWGSNEVEVAHGADLPVRVYPIIETALRAGLGISPEEHRRSLGLFAERFSRVAAGNPHAWFPVERTAQEAVDTAGGNRMIGYPYTKYLNAVMDVDQAAALIMTTAGIARSLGVPEDRWVYLHGGQDAHDLWYVSDRPSLAESPAIAACVGDALAQADFAVEDVAGFDLYSCFPCMPRIAPEALGISPEDTRPMTLTGGLPYFGGPGSNYSMHAIAEAVARCREAPKARILVTANGWYCTKHSAGVYSGVPRGRPWARTAPERFQDEIDLPQPLVLDAEPSGSLTIDGYTVWHGRDGDPLNAIFCGHTAAGKRAWAQSRPGDRELLQAIMAEEWVGRTGRITGRKGQVNHAEF
jgi:acetyl-CoA C-acetyltransferase